MDRGARWLHGGCDLHLGLKASRRTKTMRVTLKAHQSKKGKTWRIGYKAHIGVDAAGGLVHGVETIT
jgi:IS5 family transposase